MSQGFAASILFQSSPDSKAANLEGIARFNNIELFTSIILNVIPIYLQQDEEIMSTKVRVRSEIACGFSFFYDNGL